MNLLGNRLQQKLKEESRPRKRTTWHPDKNDYRITAEEQTYWGRGSRREISKERKYLIENSFD